MAAVSTALPIPDTSVNVFKRSTGKKDPLASPPMNDKMNPAFSPPMTPEQIRSEDEGEFPVLNVGTSLMLCRNVLS